MNFYDKRYEGEAALPALGPGLQSLAHGLIQQLHQNRERRAFSEVLQSPEGGNLTPAEAEIIVRSQPREQPIMLKLLGAMKQMRQPEAQGLSALNEDRAFPISDINSSKIPTSLDTSRMKPTLASAANATSIAPKDLMREQRMRAKDEFAKEQAAKKEQHTIEKGNEEFKKEMRIKEAKRKTLLNSLDAMEAASKSGNINSPWALAAMNIGNSLMPAGKNPFDYFKTPETQSFLTHSKALFGIGKELFGSRITNADLPIIEAMLPSLMQNPETREMVIKAMQEINELAGKEYQIMKDIISENGGKEPKDLAGKVAERFDKVWDEGSKNLTAVIGMSRSQSNKPDANGISEGTVWEKNGKPVVRIGGKDVPAKQSSNGKWVRA